MPERRQRRVRIEQKHQRPSRNEHERQRSLRSEHLHRHGRLVARWQSLGPSLQDALIALTFLLVGLLLIVTNSSRVLSGAYPTTLQIVLFLVTVAVQTQRRRHPVGALLAGTVLLATDLGHGLSLPIILIVTDLIYTAVLYSGQRASGLVIRGLVVASAVVVAVVAILSGQLRDVVFGALLVTAAVLLPVQTAFAVRLYRDRAVDARQHAEDVARLADAERVATLQADRARTAHRLHDVISAELSSIALRSAALLEVDSPAAKDGARRQQIVEDVRDASLRGLQGMREMIDALQSPPELSNPVAPQPLPRTLTDSLEAARRMDDRFRVHVELTPERLGELPAAVDAMAAAVITEALTNAGRYAAAGELRIEVDATREGMLFLRVSSPLAQDDGHRDHAGGADSRQTVGAGLGLAGAARTVITAGGRFAAGPSSGRIFEVVARMPRSCS